MTYRKAVRIVRQAGMSVEDGLGFTVCGGQLVNGEPAPRHLIEMNGSHVEDIAARIAGEGEKR